MNKVFEVQHGINSNKFIAQADNLLTDNQIPSAVRIRNAETLYAFAFKEANANKDYIEQVLAINKLANLYHQYLKDYPKATALYNYALNLCQASLINERQTSKLFFQEQQDTIEHSLAQVANDFILACKGDGSVFNYRKDNHVHKNYVLNMRGECTQLLADLDKQYDLTTLYQNLAIDEMARQTQLAYGQGIHNIYLKIAADVKAFIKLLVAECVAVLGEPPCSYSLIGMGSLARCEMTPFSDLEFAILLADSRAECKAYFRNLTNLLHLKILNLGQTILPALAIKSLDGLFDATTPRGLAFDAALPQACKTPHGKQDENGQTIFELIGTAKELLNYQGNKWLDDEPHLSDVLANVTYICGDESLYTDYQKLIEAKLANDKYQDLPLRAYRALHSLGENIDNIYDILFNYNYEGTLFDVKKQIYRLTDRISSAIGNYFGWYGKSASEVVIKLHESGYINDKARDNLFIIVNIATQIRLRTYLKKGRQHESLQVFDQQALSPGEAADYFCLPDLSILYRFYYSLIPLYKFIAKFYEQRGLTEQLQLKENDFFDAHPNTQLLTSNRLLQYENSLQALEKWEHLEADNPSLLNAQTVMFCRLGFYDKSVKAGEQLFKQINLADYTGLAPILDVQIKLNVLATLSIAYQHLYQFKEAETCYDLAMKIIFKEIFGFDPEQHLDDSTSIALKPVSVSPRKVDLIYKVISSFAVLAANKAALGDRTSCDRAIQLLEFYSRFLVAISQRQEIYQLVAADCKVRLAHLYCDSGHLAKAKNCLEEALTSYDKHYGSQPNMTRADCYNALARVQLQLKNYNSAEACLMQALATVNGLFGKKLHPAKGHYLANLGKVYHARAKLPHFETYYQQALLYYSFALDSKIDCYLQGMTKSQHEMEQSESALRQVCYELLELKVNAEQLFKDLIKDPQYQLSVIYLLQYLAKIAGHRRDSKVAKFIEIKDAGMLKLLSADLSGSDSKEALAQAKDEGLSHAQNVKTLFNPNASHSAKQPDAKGDEIKRIAQERPYEPKSL